MGARRTSLTPGQRVQYYAARVLAALPPRLQVRLSGRPPVCIDGDTLAPETQLTLALLERRGEPPPETLPPVRAREQRRALLLTYGGRPAAVGAVRDLELDTEVPLRARLYVPGEQGQRPLLVYFHGGGFLYGDLDTHDGVCRLLCRHSGANVLAVDYRLAPEHPFPAAVEDARAALGWAHANAARLGADPRRVGVGGDSAGGNLAAVVSQLAAHDGGPAPALQLLIYPVTDLGKSQRSYGLFGEGFLLTRAEMQWFEDNYLGAAHAYARDPRVSPLLAHDLSGLAPAILVTAAFDPLRDEGEEYAHALRDAGTPVTLRRFAGFIHGFINGAGVSASSHAAVAEIGGMTRTLFETAAPARESEHDAGAERDAGPDGGALASRR